MAVVEPRVVSDVHRSSPSQEPDQHGAGENLGQYDCRALSQPAHVLETDFPPAYAPLAPYKFIAVELDLVPVSSGTIVPDLRWLVGSGFAIVFLLVGWLHAALLG